MQNIKDISTDDLAKLIWEYHHLHQELKKSDAIFVLGNHDERVAVYAASLFLKGLAPLIIFSGLGSKVRDSNALKKSFRGKSEADHFADIAKEAGVPEDSIIIENNSTNTGENFEFTEKLLKEKGINVDSVILVQKPYMERRTYATGKKWWPNKELISVSPPVSFEEYTSGNIPKDHVLSSMVGDLQRIKTYPEKGFQIPQDIPDDVWEAGEELARRGFNTRCPT